MCRAGQSVQRDVWARLEVAEHARRTVGREDVWSRTSTLHALGLVRAAQGRTGEAESLLQEALAVVEPTMYRHLADEVRASLETVRNSAGAALTSAEPS